MVVPWTRTSLMINKLVSIQKKYIRKVSKRKNQSIKETKKDPTRKTNPKVRVNENISIIYDYLYYFINKLLIKKYINEV